MITNDISTLKIHTLSQEQYDNAKKEGKIKSNEIYLTPDTEIIIDQEYSPESKNPQSGIAVTEMKQELLDITNPKKTTSIPWSYYFYLSQLGSNDASRKISRFENIKVTNSNIIPKIESYSADGISIEVDENNITTIKGNLETVSALKYKISFTCPRSGHYYFKDFKTGTISTDSTTRPRLELYRPEDKNSWYFYQSDSGSISKSINLTKGDKLQLVIWIYPNTDYNIVLKPLLSDCSRDTSSYVPKIIDFSLSYLYENANKRNKAYYSSDGILTTYNFSSMNSLNDNPSFYTSPGTRIVSLDYYQDINTIIEKLTNAIITLGGNV